MLDGSGFNFVIRFSVFITKRREPLLRMTLDEIRRRPTLPGRFQPSTISVLRLNFCVRDGNRWVPQAIVTGNHSGVAPDCCRLPGSVGSAFHRPPPLPLSSPLSGFRSPFGFRNRPDAFVSASSAPSKPHRSEFRFRLTMASASLL